MRIARIRSVGSTSGSTLKLGFCGKRSPPSTLSWRRQWRTCLHVSRSSRISPGCKSQCILEPPRSRDAPSSTRTCTALLSCWPWCVVPSLLWCFSVDTAVGQGEKFQLAENDAVQMEIVLTQAAEIGISQHEVEAARYSVPTHPLFHAPRVQHNMPSWETPQYAFLGVADFERQQHRWIAIDSRRHRSDREFLLRELDKLPAARAQSVEQADASCWRAIAVLVRAISTGTEQSNSSPSSSDLRALVVQKLVCLSSTALCSPSDAALRQTTSETPESALSITLRRRRSWVCLATRYPPPGGDEGWQCGSRVC